MKLQRALVGFAAITLAYVGILIWADARNHVFAELPRLLSALPVLMSLSLLSYVLRYTRWHWLLRRAGHETSPVMGFLAYLAGFAFTATPGKVGELVRIRYLGPRGVPPERVLAAFIYERAFDLIVVVLLSALAISRVDVFIEAVGFTMIVLVGLIVVMLKPTWLTKASAYLRLHHLERFARVCVTVRDGLSGCRNWATPLDVFVSLGLGLPAWSLTSLSFVWLLGHLGVSLPLLSAVAIYPLAMLAGAASMLPGGIGSTEAAIVTLLSFFDVSFGMAVLAAVGIRFSSMWFAVLCGLVALGILELLARSPGEIHARLRV